MEPNRARSQSYSASTPFNRFLATTVNRARSNSLIEGQDKAALNESLELDLLMDRRMSVTGGLAGSGFPGDYSFPTSTSHSSTTSESEFNHFGFVNQGHTHFPFSPEMGRLHFAPGLSLHPAISPSVHPLLIPNPSATLLPELSPALERPVSPEEDAAAAAAAATASSSRSGQEDGLDIVESITESAREEFIARRNAEEGGGGGNAKGRFKPSEEELEVLNRVFQKNPFPSVSLRKKLADNMALDAKQVQFWQTMKTNGIHVLKPRKGKSVDIKKSSSLAPLSSDSKFFFIEHPSDN
ncbi:hypothetical protein HDU98_009654 [Podochytrium sp. JEL0797]|nr:hypothetical protein HDU98_009654 [Podochytrium sp. JEL0797]